jgi:NADPH2:quinone reductase
VVDEVGPDVDADWVGRRVVAHLGASSAGYAELAVVEAKALHVLPEGKDDAAAVAMIGTGRTAFGILGWAELTAEDVVLVTSAAGGLGVLLAQAARNAGALVVGAAGGPDKVERLRQSGVGVAVDYDREDWAQTVRSALGERKVSIVLDAIGGVRGRAALELLGPGGRFLVYGWSSGEPTRLGVEDLVGRGITASAAIGPRILHRPGGLRDLEEEALAALATGGLVPLVTSFPLAEAAAAHEALEGRRTVGKVVLIP